MIECRGADQAAICGFDSLRELDVESNESFEALPEFHESDASLVGLLEASGASDAQVGSSSDVGLPEADSAGSQPDIVLEEAPAADMGLLADRAFQRKLNVFRIGHKHLSNYARAMIANVYASMLRLSRKARQAWTGTRSTREALARVCGVSGYEIRQILDRVPHEVLCAADEADPIDAEAGLLDECCDEQHAQCGNPEIVGGTGPAASELHAQRANQDIVGGTGPAANQLLRNTVIVGLWMSAEGRSNLAFAKEMQRLRRLRAAVGTKLDSKQFFRKVTRLGTDVLHCQDAARFSELLGGLGIESDFASLADGVAIGSSAKVQGDELFVVCIAIVNASTG